MIDILRKLDSGHVFIDRVFDVAPGAIDLPVEPSHPAATLLPPSRANDSFYP
jgi:hypothetical protein